MYHKQNNKQKKEKIYVEKTGIMVLLLLVFTLVMAGVIYAILSLMKITDYQPTGLAGIFGAMFIGYLYSAKTKEAMPKSYKMKLTIIYAIIQIILAIAFVLIVGFPNIVLFSVILVIITVFYSLFVYWMMGIGSKNCLKGIELRKQRMK